MSLLNGQIRALAERVAASHGLDVVDVEFAGGGGKHRTLRVFLERNAAGRRVLEQRLAAMRAEPAGEDSRGKAADEQVEESQGASDGDVGDATNETIDGDLDGYADRNSTGDGNGSEPLEEPETESEPFASEEMELDHNLDQELDEDQELDHALDIELDLVEAGEAAGLSPEEDELAYLREVPAGVPVEQLSGITHGDCERFSRDFGTALDIEELVAGTEYLLEASSPGLDRKLSKREEFVRFAGLLCKVQTFTPIAGNRHWQGHLGPVTGDALQLVPVTAKGGKKKKSPAAEKPLEIPLGNIEKAQLVPEF